MRYAIGLRVTLNNYKKVAWTTFLLIILAFSLVSVSSGLQSYSAISSTGMVSYWPQVFVNVNLSDVIGSNNLSLGFMLSYEWKIWRDSAVRRQLAEDAGFKMVRIFDFLINPCSYWNESSRSGIFNWANVDLLVQRVFEVGAEPLVCLGNLDHTIEIPLGMAVNSTTGLPHPESFAAYCAEWIRHFKVAGLHVRYYEVFNEAWYYFYRNWNWNEVKAGYFLELFNTCYYAMHAENDQILVGNDASLHRKFLDYWKAHEGFLDFLSFHKYDCDGISMGDETPLLRAERRYFVTDSLFYGINDARQIWGANLPAIASECNWAATCVNGTDPRIQQVVGTVWLALVLRTAILENVQYYLYFSFSSSKSWELANKPSGGFGFGMINHDDNQPWYPYYLQKLIGTNLSIRDLIIESETSSNEIRSLAWFHGGTLNILLISKINETRIINLQGVVGQLNFSKIDNNVSYLTPSIQIGQVNATDALITNGYTVILLQSSI